jgi:hypothetical protein
LNYPHHQNFFKENKIFLLCLAVNKKKEL